MGPGPYRCDPKPAPKVCSGSCRVTLIAAQLVDEFRVWIYPVVLGKGKRLFEESVPAFGLTLVESRSTSRGILMNTYRPAGPLPDMSVQPDNPSDAELARRRKLAEEGWTIILNIGDQESDLAGGFAERTFKLPNPFYYTK